MDVAYEIESKRNDIAYGKKSDEKMLRNLINLFLNAKMEVENEYIVLCEPFCFVFIRFVKG